MNDEQWKNLLAVLDGQVRRPTPRGFIIDSPWLPGWCGVDICSISCISCRCHNDRDRCVPGLSESFSLCFHATMRVPILELLGITLFFTLF
jgi:hypothetical protein